MKKIKRILFYYHSLSILKKFLLAPLFGIILVLPFYNFIFLSMLEMKHSVNSVNSELIPLYEVSCDNILLLENIVSEIDSAVSSKEIEWVETSNRHAEKIRKNLNNHLNSNYKEDIQESIIAFDNYYETIEKVSKKIIKNNHFYHDIENDTKTLIKDYNKISMLLKNLKSKTKDDIEKNIDSIYKNTNFVLLKGTYIFFIWFFTSTLIIYLVYKDIKYRIKRIVEDSKEIARGDVDFEKRLCIVSYDELGQIVRSLNIFINKLHKKHEELLEAKKELDTLYITDRLTNVYNRVKIDEIIDIACKKKETFSVILIDIDHFKLVNDTHGHLVGDSILKEFATILKDAARDTDFIGRWGGEEFIVVCTQTSKEDAISLAEHLRTKIQDFDFTKVGKKTASFGVAVSRENNDAESIIDNADKALYRAKNGGRNQVICYQ
jgi:diguanylate cyclase (GGDEF)-like protein